MLLITSLKQKPNEEDFDRDDANDKVNEDFFFHYQHSINHFKMDLFNN